jgi:hypothetical protein
MTALSRLLGVALLGLCAFGCTKRQNYEVAWLYSETLNKRLDAHWFMREINDGNGLQAVELMYCPAVPGQPTICRTAVVWERDKRSLLDHPRLSPPPPDSAR